MHFDSPEWQANVLIFLPVVCRLANSPSVQKRANVFTVMGYQGRVCF